MSENNEYSVIYLKFLNLYQAVREMPNFSSIGPAEEHLLNMIADLWHQDKKITVLETLNLSANISSTTLHRRLTSLRLKGWIALQVNEVDGRVKYVTPTDLTIKYFATMGRTLVSAQQNSNSRSNASPVVL